MVLPAGHTRPRLASSVVTLTRGLLASRGRAREAALHPTAPRTAQGEQCSPDWKKVDKPWCFPS